MKASGKDDCRVKCFKDNAFKAYLNCSAFLQEKMPLDSQLVKSFSALDPTARCHSFTASNLKKLPGLMSNVLCEAEKEKYLKEIHTYQIDNGLQT